jgi:hypothetical protein
MVADINIYWMRRYIRDVVSKPGLLPVLEPGCDTMLA